LEGWDGRILARGPSFKSSPAARTARCTVLRCGKVLRLVSPGATFKLEAMKTKFTFISLGFALALTGCKAIGPGTVAHDRFDYSAAIGDSWKRQTLLNIVKLRYLDPPIFVDVGQIVAGYTLETGISAGGQLAKEGAGDQFLAMGGHGTFTDRPTITYTPLTGDKFIRSLMTPLTPQSVVFMIQSGWPADGVLFATTASINGLKNQETTVDGTTPPEPDFIRALVLLRKIQKAGRVALRIQEDAQKGVTTLLSLPRADIAPETLADRAELARLLRLDPNATVFNLVFGDAAANDKEVAMRTRSIIQLMGILAALVDVPAKDLAEHRVAPGWESMPGAPAAMRMLEIHCSGQTPPNAFVSVNYRDHWFWIDDRDLKSKRAFSFMMGLFTLADTSERVPLPQLTIPAQ
jgi:hypothetical protein